MMGWQRLLLTMCICITGCLFLSGCVEKSQDNLEETQRQGYDQGYAAGEAEGYSQGLADGKEQSSVKIDDSVVEVIETPYYTIEIPSSWKGTYEYTYEEGFPNVPTIAAYAGYSITITNKVDGKIMFTVCCGKEEYTGVGNGWSEIEIGRTTIDPQYKIYLGRTMYANVGDEKAGYGEGFAFGPDRTDEYINYITIK